jgi:hypothetical protein
MTQEQTIAAGVAEVVAAWLTTAPGQPLTLTADGNSVRARIGNGDDRRLTKKAAAELLGMEPITFKRNHFFGLKLGEDRKYSRRQVERVKQERER